MSAITPKKADVQSCAMVRALFGIVFAITALGLAWVTRFVFLVVLKDPGRLIGSSGPLDEYLPGRGMLVGAQVCMATVWRRLGPELQPSRTFLVHIFIGYDIATEALTKVPSQLVAPRFLGFVSESYFRTRPAGVPQVALPFALR